MANLYVGNGNSAFLQFDLGSLPAGITASQVAKATVTVYVNRVNTAGLVLLSPVTSGWNENSVTFGTQPTIGAFSASFSATTAGQFETVDITTLVQAWISSPASNFGIALSSSGANVLFDSKENDQTGHAAVLDITVTSMGPTGAVGAMGLQGPQGIQGLTGASGAMGASGAQGLPGLTGLTGGVGLTGAAGPAGPQGIQGLTGASGSLGHKGYRG